MVAMLDGGCRVADLKEGEPVRDGALRIWNHFRGDALSLRVIEIDRAATLRNEAAEEVLYVVGGNGTANGEAVETNTGIYLPPNTSLELIGMMTLVSSQCGDLGGAPALAPVRAGAPLRIVSLEEKPMQKTGDRWYR